MQRFGLPEGYIERLDPDYFSDAEYYSASVIHQPEVYDAADYLLRSSGRSIVVDIGCGTGRKLLTIQAQRRIGVDFGSNIAFCRSHHADWGEWVEADLSNPPCLAIADLANHDTVVICADVVEHLPDPGPLLSLLAACYRNGAIVLTSTPDRERVRGAEHKGPPPNAAHVREWALDEYSSLLSSMGLPPTFAGYTLNNNAARELKTIVSVHDIGVDRARAAAALSWSRPVAIMSTFNEIDVISEVVLDLLSQGCDVVALDNWSTDKTWERLESLAAEHPGRMRAERFPASGPTACYEWQQILRRKEEIAAGFRGRWVMHTDADEIRRAPFPGLTIAEGFRIAEWYGANRVGFNLISFRPIDDRPFGQLTLEGSLPYFEYGTRPGHFLQRKAWLQGSERVDLASTGGHEVSFSGARDFPYRFLLKHYPIRSSEHGRNKVIHERQARWSPHEKNDLGWHTQYDHYSSESDFSWRTDDLYRFDSNFWREHGLVITTDIGERRLAASRRAPP